MKAKRPRRPVHVDCEIEPAEFTLFQHVVLDDGLTLLPWGRMFSLTTLLLRVSEKIGAKQQTACTPGERSPR